MRLPRDLSGPDLDITVPQHNPLRVGTLAAILVDIARHFETTRDDLVARLFREK